MASPQLSTIAIAFVVGYIFYTYFLKPTTYIKESDETFVSYQPLNPIPPPITPKTQVFPSVASVSNRVNAFSKGPGFPIIQLKPAVPPVVPKVSAAAKPAAKPVAKAAAKTAAKAAVAIKTAKAGNATTFTKLDNMYPIIEMDNGPPVQPGR